jgi:hypothetical protein
MIAMFRILWAILIVLLAELTLVTSANAQEPGASTTPSPTPPPLPQITVPLPGQALQGKVAILGVSAVPDAKGYELSFIYANQDTPAWFLVQEGSPQAANEQLGEWDTSVITDGTYDLRLVVYRETLPPLTAIVRGLRVRNYTPIETSTPTPLTPTATPAPGELTATPTPSSSPSPSATLPAPTLTPLPTNQIVLTSLDLLYDMGRGGLIVIGLFALGGIYLMIKQIYLHTSR